MSWDDVMTSHHVTSWYDIMVPCDVQEGRITASGPREVQQHFSVFKVLLLFFLAKIKLPMLKIDEGKILTFSVPPAISNVSFQFASQEY